LQLKKYRKQAQSFSVEGAKSVLELAQSSFEITHLMVTKPFWEDNEKSLKMLEDRVAVVTNKQLTAISAFKTNEAALAVARFRQHPPWEVEPDEYVIALDRIRDPGNFGTILRIADWYGINKVVASSDSADYYHPKVIQASMGSFTRVAVYHQDLHETLQGMTNIFAAGMKGEDVHKVDFPAGGVLVIGNEAQGLDTSLTPLIHQTVCIPGYGVAESLNAAVATAVICDNIRRSLNTN